MKNLFKLIPLLWIWIIPSSLATGTEENQQDEKPNNHLQVKGSISTGAVYLFPSCSKDVTCNPILIFMPPSSEEGNIKFAFRGGLSLKKEFFVGNEALVVAIKSKFQGKDVKIGGAYIEGTYFRIGHTGSNFADSEEFLPFPGGVGASVVQLQVKYVLGPHSSAAIAVEENPFHTKADKKEKEKEKEKNTKSFLPAVSISVKCKGEKGHIHLGGLVRCLSYSSSSNNKRKIIPTGGITISGSVHPIPDKVTLQVQGFYGNGIGEYVTGGLLDEENKSFYMGPKDAVVLIEACGVGGNIKYQWTSQFFSILSSGLLQIIDNKNNPPRSDVSLKRQYFAAMGLGYNLSDHINLGASYKWGQGYNVKKESKYAHSVGVGISCSL